jgi:selenide,water dikinase
MAPGDLQEVLAILRPGGVPPPAELLVGLGAADDAAVYRLAPDLALVATVDFFPPVVDDPWTWGAVAAVNAMSDVYAMGGDVLFALAVAGFPREMSKTIISEVFRGGRDKVGEAGGVIAGGHTVVDAEPKYGLCVTGRVHPDRILTKGGLRAGDRVFLSKPLGTGVITTAAKNGVAGVEWLGGAVASMLRLNRVAATVARESGATGATDITGFGFLGHAGEMVKASGAGLSIDASRLPVLPGTRELAEKGQFSGGMKRNRRYVDEAFGSALTIDPSVPGDLASLLTESETSGGLLFSVAFDRAGSVVDAFRRRGEECWEIGMVLPEPVIRIKA